MNFIKGIGNWTFQDEPLYRWAIFLVAITIIMMAWRCVLGYMER